MDPLARNIGAALTGGGGHIIGRQLKRNATTGALEVLATGSDCLGAAAGSWHQFGSIETIDIPRDANGHHTASPTLVEFDVNRRNLLIKIAPLDASGGSTKKEALSLENSVVVQSSDATGEDTTLPYWDLVYHGAPYTDGTETAFSFVGQAKREGGSGATKAGSFNKPKISFNSIDAGGFTPDFSDTDEDWLDDITPVALSGDAAHGIWLEATA